MEMRKLFVLLQKQSFDLKTVVTRVACTHWEKDSVA